MRRTYRAVTVLAAAAATLVRVPEHPALTDLYGLSPDDAIASAVHTARVLTEAATGKTVSPRRGSNRAKDERERNQAHA